MDISSNRILMDDYDSQLEKALQLSIKSAEEDQRRRYEASNIKLPPPPINSRRYRDNNSPDLISCLQDDKKVAPPRPAPPSFLNNKLSEKEDFIPLPPRPSFGNANFQPYIAKPVVGPNVELIDLSSQTTWSDCSDLDLRAFDPFYTKNECSFYYSNAKIKTPNMEGTSLKANHIPSSAYLYIPACNNRGTNHKAELNLVTPTEEMNTEDDLIFFPETYDNLASLSLCDFDPLYANCNVPSSKLDRSLTPIPSYFVNKVDNVQRSIIPNEWLEPKKPMSSHHSSPDLHDPFSFETLSQQRQLNKNADVTEPVEIVPKPELSKSKKKRILEYEFLEEIKGNTNDEVQAFLNMVDRLKQSHDLKDPILNCGYVLAAQSSHKVYTNHTVKLIVTGDFIPDSIVFICDVSSRVDHVISHVLLSLVEDRNVSLANYALKVFGSSEYLENDKNLCDYEYIQKCLKMGFDIKFVIVERENIKSTFKRTNQDNKHPVFVPKAKSITNENPINQAKLNILLKAFYDEIKKLQFSIFNNDRISLQGLRQIVKAICTILFGLDNREIQNSMQSLILILGETLPEKLSHSREALYFELEGFDLSSLQNSGLTKKQMEESYIYNQFLMIRDSLILAIKKHILMFTEALNTNFKFPSFLEESKSIKDISNLTDYFNCRILSIYRIPQAWLNTHSEFKVQCSVRYGEKNLGEDAVSELNYSTTPFHASITWNEDIRFDELQLNTIPREAKLCFTLVGSRLVNTSTHEGHMKVNRPFAWVVWPLYNFKNELSQGKYLLPMWNYNLSPFSTANLNDDFNNCPLLQIELKEYDCNYVFPQVEKSSYNLKKEILSLQLDEQDQLRKILSHKNILSKVEREFLWNKKYYLFDVPEALPVILRMVTNWSHYSLNDLYSMLAEWAPLSPLLAIQLLLPRYPDCQVRKFAVERLKCLKVDEFTRLLPQLVQALKFESYHVSALAELLLERAITNVRVAQNLYWYLKEASENLLHRKRYQLMFGALLSVIGQGMRDELAKEEEFVNIVSSIANRVKVAKDKEMMLQRSLEELSNFFMNLTLRLPFNPSLEVSGIDVKSCSFFTSFTFPLKLAMKNIDKTSDDIYIMFKVGDDLRQDMLTIQMINMMDQLWLQQGLDLKMVTFRCQTTGPKQGFVELVMESDTLGKIQKKYGHSVTGPFRDKTIANWLQIHNPSELDYQRAVENFTSSCAGYCIATYLLGICDRHNDNIMITHSGHIFHIDFAKFLGDLQTFGSFNRDRTPFVLTSDMAYVINGGDKPTENFQNFIDLCCRAFNIIRNNGDLILNLITLMYESGIPRVNKDAVKYIHSALMPKYSDAEAVSSFTKMIHSSLKSIFTQFNFFIHNLAQLKFSGHDDGSLLSFIPKTYSKQTDGEIVSLELNSIQKRYSPEKFYLYIVKIERLNQRVPSYVLRRYSEFHEFHKKLSSTFPLVTLPPLSAKKVIGRSQVRTVAEIRKSEIEDFIRCILQLSSEVKDHDLVYTFFHPMLRDEQEIKWNQLKVKDSLPSNQHNRRIDGFVKLNLFYRNDVFTVMVMHIKDLNFASGTPNPYVKLYLLPDPTKETKKKKVPTATLR